MIRRPTRSTRTDTRFPYTTLFRSNANLAVRRRDGVFDGIFDQWLQNEAGHRERPCIVGDVDLIMETFAEARGLDLQIKALLLELLRQRNVLRRVAGEAGTEEGGQIEDHPFRLVIEAAQDERGERDRKSTRLNSSH